MPSRLHRFTDAQDQPHAGFQSALSEIRAGGKQSHWIWYIFPQLSGMGYSAASRAYGLDGVGEAEEYLRDSLLRSRLLTIASAVVAQLESGVALSRLMGSSIDVTKLVSSMTLFAGIAQRLRNEESLDEYARLAEAANTILTRAADAGIPPCQFTLHALENQ